MSGRKEGGEFEQGRESNERGRRSSYLEARHYLDANEAAQAYLQSQEAIRRGARNASLSVYRLLLGPLLEAHVVVLGDTPNKKLLEELEDNLSKGEHVELEADVLEHLMQRRAQAEKIGPWVERHFEPGRSVRLPRRSR